MKSGTFICGVVEGFYGRPWSAGQRHTLFGWMRRWRMNTYLYAPKDNLKHRTCWREPYDGAEAHALKSLIHDCHSHGLNFVYAIAPGLDISYSSLMDLRALQRRTGQLLRLGCRNFALLFDDIPPALRQADAKRFGSTAAAQCSVANDLLRFIQERVTKPMLLFCPTQYCGRMSGALRGSQYLNQLGQLLDPQIEILWTGPEIVSETISVGSIRELRSAIRRKPLIWDNLHANDYDLRRIYLGPYAGRSPELQAEVSGILSNPSCEFEANYIPLRTLSMFCRNRSNTWNPARAMQVALNEWLPRWNAYPPAVITSGDVELLRDCLYLPYESGPVASRLVADLDFLLQTPSRQWGAVEPRFVKTCNQINAVFDKMTALKNRELLYSLYRHVWELKEEMALLRNYIAWLKSDPANHGTFTSAEHRSKVYRGGLVAELQRRLPMDGNGQFARPSPKRK